MIDFRNNSIIKLSKTSPDAAQAVLPLFVAGEEIIGVYKAIRDYVVFTNKRIISVNVQGVTGKKKDFTSLPYSKIQVFSIETAGTLDLDSELELYFSGLGLVKFEFSGASDIVKIGQLISNAIL
ncbi:MAG: PH domain-containing protein [Lachnospiraceae bacterium]|nr:PH domain-containing protein [Lachnospiraceae bacterium]